jgi:tetratricopeptide (TPR) repeat protein
MSSIDQSLSPSTGPALALRNPLESAAHGSPRARDRRFEQGLYAYHRGDYSVALSEFERACELPTVRAARSADYARIVEGYTYILRILAEREEFAKIERIEHRILEVLKVAGLPHRLKSRALYVLGICNCYQETKHDLAMRRFREAIDFAVIGEDKEALASPLYGAATVHYARENYDQALKELDRLAVLLSCLKVPELESASSLLRAMVYRNQDHLDQALSSAWQAFESLKHHPNLVLYLHTLCVLGTVYRRKSDMASARLYLDLADRSLKRQEFPRIARLVDEAFESLGTVKAPEADLVFDARTGILTEKVKGEIRFEGQFILRDLLKAFLENPGRIFTKEDLVASVWRETYNPKVHDNKIYVTIKRLRKLLEPENSKSDYILRAKNGYFLNPKTRVQINDQPFTETSK